MALPTKSQILAYFNSIKGKSVLSGQFTEIKGSAPLANIQTATNQWLSIIGGDYWWFGQSGTVYPGYPFNVAAIPYAQAGGLVCLSLSMPNPTTGKSIQDLTSLDATGLLTAGTVTNTTLNGYLADIATGLKQLQAAGICPIIRPLHENNGNWFWYGTTFLSAPQFVALWQYIYNYFTITSGLTNLIWLWSVNSGIGSFPQTLSRYPGNSFVDMVGFDVYTNNPSATMADYNSLITLGKPVCMAEFGSGSPSLGDPTFDQTVLISTLKSMPEMVFWQQWWGSWDMINNKNTSTALNDPYVVNRAQLTIPALPTPTPPVANTITISSVQQEVMAAIKSLNTILSQLKTANTNLDVLKTETGNLILG